MEPVKKHPLFTIIVVSLNSGDKLSETVANIFRQSYTDFQVVVKDGVSTDSSVEKLNSYVASSGIVPGKVDVISKKDTGIYDAMNQAMEYARGEYYYFLNCGDTFYSNDVLSRLASKILSDKQERRESKIYYGDIFDELRQQVVAENPRIDAFACYRHIPCHQACFYSRELFAERGYDLSYKIRADYEHFLWSFFWKEISPQYINMTLASYEGGGYSETEENLKLSAKEHKEITEKYMSKMQLLKYKTAMTLTMAPLRKKMAESEKTAAIYQGVKRLIYKK